MRDTPLIVVPARPASLEDALALLRRARRLLDALGEDGTLLLLCALPDADASRLPQDDALIRLLQSGIASADARLRGRLLLLVCPRAWDDAARAYVCRPDAALLTARLLMGLEPGMRFEAASFSPASLKGAHACALLLPDAFLCTPDIPQRLMEALGALPCVTGSILPAFASRDTLLTRLQRMGFDLSPVREAAALFLAKEGLAPLDGRPVLLSAGLLKALAQGKPLPGCCPSTPDCVFVRREADTPDSLLAENRAVLAEALRQERPSPLCRRVWLEAVLPLLRLLLLLAGAALGLPLLCAVAVFAPEWHALLHPRLLPGMLARLVLLPAQAMGALDVLLRRLLARSRVFRVELPASAFSSRACVVCGIALLLGAIFSARAAAPLLVVSLLWLFAPVIFSALASPVRERIPLTETEQEEMLGLARSAFFRLPEGSACLRALADCAGCMLGLLEPDEAARRVESRLEQLQTPPSSALEQACLLSCAQFLRERMAACDAALRPLPARLEAAVSAAPPPEGPGRLAALLRAARSCDACAFDQAEASGDAIDALFLPPVPGAPGGEHTALLPLTHPHTFLAHPPPETGKGGETDELLRFLALSASALHAPFAALLARSPAVEAYLPLLACVPPQKRRIPARSALIRSR